MRIDDFDFELPTRAIAQRPTRPRDAARLLQVGEKLSAHRVRDLPNLLAPGDLIVCNDTRVLPARLFGRRRGVAIEVTLYKALADGRWRALAKRSRRLKPGDRVDFAADFWATVEAKGDGGEVVLAFNRVGSALMAALDDHGAMPVPPYIKRPAGIDREDRVDYQTVFAAAPGAIAAPTAGLHFTADLIQDLERRGIRLTTLTLHVGAGTFLPVTATRIEDHVMHSEWGEIGASAAAVINDTRAAGGRVVAVGTTVLRLLEAASDVDGRVKPFCGETDLFITPGFRFRVADLLLTNFHLPRSTLFMLVCAFSGTERIKSAYRHAIDDGYRFYSYGDCCLLHRGVTA